MGRVDVKDALEQLCLCVEGIEQRRDESGGHRVRAARQPVDLLLQDAKALDALRDDRGHVRIRERT